MSKAVKYTLLLLVIGWLGFKSVYIKKLSEVEKTSGGKFDAVEFSKKLWDEKLPGRLDSAVAFTALVEKLKSDPVGALEKNSNSMGIGNYRYSLVKLTGTATEIKDDAIAMQTRHGDSIINVTLATEYIYGNAIRDASGLLDIKDFTNTTDLNNISEQLNATVRNVILPPFKKSVKTGDTIEATGAIEFNKEHIRVTDLELIPVRLKILP